jgi:hypothetical protein
MSHSRIRLDPRFAQHLRIPAGTNPDGVVMHLVNDDGELVHERKLDAREFAARVSAVEDVERFKREHPPGRYFLYGYDGDSGECLGTLVIEP